MFLHLDLSIPEEVEAFGIEKVTQLNFGEGK